MYFSAVLKHLANLEEKLFYDVALTYLAQAGYQDLSIVDGTGDGGRDVSCSRKDLRIQLSVRAKWQDKINEEAAQTLDRSLRHMLYLTNRRITPDAEQDFRDSHFKYAGQVEIDIIDLRRIATALSRPGVIRATYELLGMAVPTEIDADAKEVALSSVLVFSSEAKHLREAIIEANVRAVLLRSGPTEEARVVSQVAASLPGENVARSAKSAISRLRTAGRVVGGANALRLSEAELEAMRAAELELHAARRSDITNIATAAGIGQKEATELLDLALELLVRSRDLDGLGQREVALRSFLANNGLSRKRLQIFEALSQSASAKIRQHGATLDRMFLTNSFDIYRALGRRTEISMVLDTSVAMPVLCGLSFGRANSRYGASALALQDACRAHNIRMYVPAGYLNEMASHGLQALEKVALFEELSETLRSALRASGNAYLSHYSHIADELRKEGERISLLDFLAYFGLKTGKSLSSVENKIQSLLEQHSIRILPDNRYDPEVHRRIVFEKSKEPPVIVQHDAKVATHLKENVNSGFILATWDNVMIEVVEELARVYADSPARVIDFLSMASGEDFETQRSYEMLTTLLHVDENVAARLADKIEKIDSTDRLFKLERIISEAKNRSGTTWDPTPEELIHLVDRAKAK